jgi:alpha-ketoglutarate-dependent taurine dioxygenase
LHCYRVLVVPQANAGPVALVAFSRRFGPLEIHSRFDNTLPDCREVFCVGNVGQASFSRGVEQWHADSSYRSVPSDASLFYGEIVPPEGADTMFADATGAYRSLDAATKQRIEGLFAVHSLETLRLWGLRHNPDRKQDVDGQAAKFPPVRQPLVREHPATGAKSLYVCPAVISHIEGMDPEESAALIDTLIAHVTQPRTVYTHRWHQGDLVMWDNRAVLHTASLFDHTRYQRLMYRTTIAGNAPGLAA